MGYRDDTVALESRCQALQLERDRLRSELTALEVERRRLDQQVTRRRWRLRVQRLLGWAGRHKLAVFLLLAAIVVPSAYGFRSHARRVWEERQTDEMMRRHGCFAFVQISSTPSAASVLLDDRKIGVTPHRHRVCPWGHRVRVVKPSYYSWQQLIQVPGRGELSVRARLYSMHATERPPGTMLLSNPPNASVFVGGQEVGHTPVFLPAGQLDPGRQLVAVAAEGYQPVLLRPQPSDTMWFNLARAREPNAGPR